jgi:histidinol-phosphate/aromatic aminotransferase/cobyric acid decarboxylase-like protein
MSISSQQSRGARGLLNWTLSDLAAASAIGLSTLKHFEHARRRTTPENLIAIRDAFEKAGIVFESDGKFVSVRLRTKHAAKAIARKRSSDIKSTRRWDEQMTAGNQDR